MWTEFDKKMKEVQTDYAFLQKIESSMTDSREDVIFMVNSYAEVQRKADNLELLLEEIEKNYGLDDSSD